MESTSMVAYKEDGKEGFHRRISKLLDDGSVFILVMVVTSWVCTCVKTSVNMCSLLNVNYIL